MTSNTYLTSLAQYVVCIYQISGHRLQNILKNPMFALVFIEKPIRPKLSFRKIGQGQVKAMF